jgi:hypothetical protein
MTLNGCGALGHPGGFRKPIKLCLTGVTITPTSLPAWQGCLTQSVISEYEVVCPASAGGPPGAGVTPAAGCDATPARDPTGALGGRRPRLRRLRSVCGRVEKRLANQPPTVLEHRPRPHTRTGQQPRTTGAATTADNPHHICCTSATQACSSPPL